MESNVYIDELVGFLPIFRNVPEVLRVTDQYLLVEQTGDTVRITGTNGALMVMYQRQAQGNLGTGLVPVEAIKEIKKIKLKYSSEVTLRWEESDRITILYAGDTIIQHIEHPANAYPKYRQVIPSKISGKTSQFDPDQLRAVKQVFATVTGKDSFHVYHNGQSAAVIVSTHSEDILGVLMPWKVDEQEHKPILEKFRQ